MSQEKSKIKVGGLVQWTFDNDIGIYIGNTKNELGLILHTIYWINEHMTCHYSLFEFNELMDRKEMKSLS